MLTRDMKIWVCGKGWEGLARADNLELERDLILDRSGMPR